MSKRCRIPSKNVFVDDLKKGTPITLCRNVFVANLRKGFAVVAWEGRYSREAQTKLNAAVKRGEW